MTANSHLKQLVRARMAATGETFTVARDHVRTQVDHVRLDDPVVADVHGRHGQAVAFTPDGLHVLSAGQDARVAVLDPAVGTLEGELLGHEKVVNAVVVLDDGARVVTVSSDRTLRTWDLDSRTEVGALFGHRDAVVAVDVVEDGGVALTGGYDGRLGVWDLAAQELVAMHETGLRRLAAVAAVGRDGLVALGGQGPVVELRDRDSGALVRAVDTGSPGVVGLAVAPDGGMVATAGYDGVVTLWSVDAWEPVRRLELDGRADAVAFSRSGRLLGIASSGRVTVVTPSADEPVAAATLPIRGVYGLAFSRDERRLAQTGADGRVRVWTLR